MDCVFAAATRTQKSAYDEQFDDAQAEILFCGLASSRAVAHGARRQTPENA